MEAAPTLSALHSGVVNERDVEVVEVSLAGGACIAEKGPLSATNIMR
jgi:hypothetical protein